MLLEPFHCSLGEKRKKKIPFGRAIGWDGGSGTAYCVFLLTFNSPKHPCFTASWAIAFLNLSLERQELWSLSIEEKGMLFPCHLLVVPPSSPVLIYGPTPHPHLTLFLSSLPLWFVVSCRRSRAIGCQNEDDEKMFRGRGVEVYWFRVAVGSSDPVTALVLC